MVSSGNRILNGDMKRTQPVVHPEIRDKVPDGHVGPAESVAEVGEGTEGEDEAKVAEEDELGVLVVIQRAAGIEVVNTTAVAVLLALATALTLTLVEVVAGDIAHEVAGPADELLADEVKQGGDGSLLGELAQLVHHLANASGMLLAGAGKENHVTLHVAGGLVVSAVGQLPAEVGDEQGRVEEPAGDVVDQGRVGEGTVAALVGDDPETGCEEALQSSVDAPEDESQRGRRHMLGGHEVVEEVESAGEARNVAQDVGVALEGRTLEAVLGDGIADVLDGVVGRRELVAVGVEQSGVLVLLVIGDVERRERRQRGGRGRLAGRVGRGDGRRGFVVSGRGRSDGAPQNRVPRQSGRGSHGDLPWVTIDVDGGEKS